MKSFLLTHPLLLASIKGCYQPKTKSFDDLTNKPPREKERKERKEKKRKENQEKNQREKEKEKREKGGEVDGSQGRRRERVHGIKEKERKSPASHHEPP